MRKYETLELRAVDFKEANYVDTCNCPVAKAAKRKFKYGYVNEGINSFSARDKNENYVYVNHDPYTGRKYDKDVIKAASHHYDNTIIRKIKLYYE